MLQGIRVLDLSRQLAGPLAGRLLADLGAEVVKVEPPRRGDPARYDRPWEDLASDVPTPVFLHANAGKRGITLDVHGERGRALFADLARTAHIVLHDADIEASRSPLSYSELTHVKPSIVLGSMSSYGADDAEQRHPSLLEYAAGGMLYATGVGTEKPVQTPDASSHLAGILLASGTLAALFRALRTGIGEHVDVAAADATFSVFYPQLSRYAFRGVIGGRGTAGRLRVTNDGWMYAPITEGRGQTLQKIADFMEIPALADERAREERPGEIEGEVSARFASWSGRTAFHQGQAAGLQWSVLQAPEDILACEQLEARGFFREAEHPIVGSVRYASSAARPDDMPPLAPPPLLGQHNAEVYGGLLGLTSEALAALEADEVI